MLSGYRDTGRVGMSREERWRKKIRTVGWILAVALAFLALAKAMAMEASVDGLEPGGIVSLGGRWEKSFWEDGTLEYSYVIDADAGDSLRFVIKTYLSSFDVCLDGEPIYEFEDPYGVKGSSLHVLRLPQQAAGETLSIRVAEPEKSVGKVNVDNAYVGTESAVLYRFLYENLYALLFGVFMLLLGAGTLGAGVYLGKRQFGDIYKGLLHLGLFILVAGVWVVTDSELLLLFTDEVAAISLVSFCSFMVMPVFLLQFINYMLGGKQSFVILESVFCCMAFLYLLNFLHPVFSGYLLLFPVHICIILSLVIGLKSVYDRQRSSEGKEMGRLMNGFGLLGVFGVIALAVFYINPTAQYSILYCLGISCFALCLLHAAFGRLYGQVEKNASIAAYKQLAYMDSMTGMKNRTAFMEEQERDSGAPGMTYILMDINNLKQTNDRYGHEEGDRLIITAAKHIRETFEGPGKCYRIGGDEFVVILERGTAEGTAETLAGMQRRIREENKGRKISLNIAAGLAVRQGKEDTAEVLFKRADEEMYAEKQRMKAER